MIDDPIVDEIRRIRRAYAERFNNDLHAICEDLRKQERESGREIRTPNYDEFDQAPDQASRESPRA